MDPPKKGKYNRSLRMNEGRGPVMRESNREDGRGLRKVICGGTASAVKFFQIYTCIKVI